MPPTERLWIATAPTGVWSSGPSVIYGEGENGLGSALAQYREMGWEVTGPYVLAPESPLRPEGWTDDMRDLWEAGKDFQASLRGMDRLHRSELSEDPPDAQRFADQCSGCYPQVTETGPCVCADDEAEEPPAGSWPHGAPGEFYEPFPEPTQAQVDEAERKLSETDQKPPDAQGSEKGEKPYEATHNPEWWWTDEMLARWEAEGGALPREP